MRRNDLYYAEEKIHPLCCVTAKSLLFLFEHKNKHEPFQTPAVTLIKNMQT